MTRFLTRLLRLDASPLANIYREQQRIQDEEEETTFKPNEPGELSTKPELLSSFLSSLEAHRIKITFIAGSWEAMLERNLDVQDSSPDLFTRPFDIVLTSETIYHLPYLTPLIILLKTASLGQKDGRNLEEMTKDMRVGTQETLCLVAAKVLYFGVGGGVIDFEKMVRSHGGQLETILEKKSGVGRRVMRVGWR